MNVKSLLAGLTFLAVSSANALTIDSGATDVGLVDLLLGETTTVKQANGKSNDAKEAAWASSVLGFDVTFSDKPSDNLGPDMQAVDGHSNLWAYDFGGAADIEYYLVKTGNGSDDKNRVFLFENQDSLNWAVVDLAAMGFGKLDVMVLSHLSAFDSGAATVSVPEPATPLLLGIGLLALGACRRRSK